MAQILNKKRTTVKQSSVKTYSAIDRHLILEKARGSWKHRSLKKDTRALAKMRSGWDRAIS